jgi:hypothetical protein
LFACIATTEKTNKKNTKRALIYFVNAQKKWIHSLRLSHAIPRANGYRNRLLGPDKTGRAKPQPTANQFVAQPWSDSLDKWWYFTANRLFLPLKFW